MVLPAWPPRMSPSEPGWSVMTSSKFENRTTISRPFSFPPKVDERYWTTPLGDLLNSKS